MAETFMCPHCGAALKYKPGGETVVTCDFCGSTVPVPEELRPKLAPQVTRSGGGTTVRLLLVLGSAACIALVGVAVAFLMLRQGSTEVSGPEFGVTTESSVIEEVGTLTGEDVEALVGEGAEESGFASLVMSFGEEGTGAGRFDDARHIAVDGEGNIYTGEYTSGRIQVFDPQGEFLTQWFTSNETPLRAVAAGRDGTVYAVFGGFIHRYVGMSGEPLGEVAYAGGRGFDDVVVTPDGGLVTAWYINRDDIVVFDFNLQPTLTITAAFESQGEPELDTHVAVDGQGNIYALGSFHSEVFKFNRDGGFVTRWGGDGDQPGQFRAVDDIAIDSQSRVYVSDIFGVQVFDDTGRYIDHFQTDGVAFGMVFDAADRLYVAARDKVEVYEINE